MALFSRKSAPRMRVDRTFVTGKELLFGENELIVTKTDLKGHILYANDVFLRLAGYPEEQMIGAPHSMIRHPHMPHGVFKLLWSTIQARKEIFAYVVNRSMNGDHYWVLAHVTPSYNLKGEHTGYHSNRRVADPRIIKEVIAPLYAATRQVEDQYKTTTDKASAGLGFLVNTLQEKGKTYDEFIFDLVR